MRTLRGIISAALFGTAALSFGSSGPTVTSVTANHGTTAGGTAVVITGTNFTGVTAVSFGGTPATSFSFVNSTTINATTPAHAHGAINVAVTTPGGTGTGTNVYTYDTITVSSVTPNHGTTNGSVAVTVSGSGFTGATSCSIASLSLTSFVVVNDTTITGLTQPTGHGAKNVVVTTAGDTGTGVGLYTYDQIIITSISPAIGDINGSEPITITGSGFTGCTDGTIGGNNIDSFIVVNDTTITGVTEANTAGAADVQVETLGETATHVGLYEFYDPTSLVDWYGSGESFAVGGGNATLTARKGVNLTIGSSAGPIVGSGGRALGGKNTIDGYNLGYEPGLPSSPSTNLSTYLPLAHGWGFAVVNVDTFAGAPDASAYDSPNIFSDSGAGYQGVGVSTNVSNHLQPWGYDGSTRVDDEPYTAGTWVLIIWKRDGTKIYSRLGSGSWSAGTTCGTLGGTGQFQMFKNWNGAQYLPGRVAVMGLGGTVPTDPQVTKLISYINAHWTQSF